MTEDIGVREEFALTQVGECARNALNLCRIAQDVQWVTNSHRRFLHFYQGVTGDYTG